MTSVRVSNWVVLGGLRRSFVDRTFSLTEKRRNYVFGSSFQSSLKLQLEEKPDVWSSNLSRTSCTEVAALVDHHVGWTLEQGLREEMEDEVAVVHNTEAGFTYLGVFDGHAGSYTSKFLKDKLYDECLKELNQGSLLSDSHAAVGEALCRAFKKLDDFLLSWQAEQESIEIKYSGSTATSVFITSKNIAVANAGDCRAVLCTSGNAEDLCNDHRPYGDSPASRSEVKRINSAGGWISRGRVCGYLAVSRAFGDLLYKSQREHLLAEGLKKGKWTKRFVQKLSLDDDWVTALPEVSCREISSEDEFILVGSDGLWDCVTSSEAVNFVKKRFQAGEDVQEVTKSLARFALDERKGDDNVSVVLVKLK